MGKKITFTVPKKLYAYRRLRDKGKYKPYSQYKERVLLLAMEAGWKGRLTALKDYPIRLSVIGHWNKNPRMDWSNLFKGVEDALFEQDQFVKPGRHSDHVWDFGKEEAIVILEF